MTALVQRQHAVAGRQQTRFVVPGAGVPRDPVQHDDGERRRRAPLRVVVTPSLQRDGPIRVHATIVTCYDSRDVHARWARARPRDRCRTVTSGPGAHAGAHVRVHAGRAGGRLLDRQPRPPRRRGPHAHRRRRARSGALRDLDRRPPADAGQDLRLLPRGDPRRARQRAAVAGRVRRDPVGGVAPLEHAVTGAGRTDGDRGPRRARREPDLRPPAPSRRGPQPERAGGLSRSDERRAQLAGHAGGRGRSCC